MIPKHILIDTNVCLDLFIFHDSRSAAIMTALQSGAVEAVTRADCHTEWQRVLQYARLPINDQNRRTINAEFDALIKMMKPTALSPRTDILLPIFSDTDDQKFLELALDAEASMLVTKDKALLKLVVKTARIGLFAIIPPQAWSTPLAE
ncbi:MAG: putative toxin-antitoxin system toxin component, PIN family [Glaciimonas sp.]|nr:putative toxin-antitoxin system toxin component, PIN family [Glaciimonas sp.]